MSDKPANVINLKALDLEALGEANDAQIPIPGGGGFIVFPDPYTKSPDEVGEYMQRLSLASDDPTEMEAFIKEHLTAADYKKFVKAFPGWKQQVYVIGKVEQHFASTLGDLEKLLASEDS